MSVSNIKLVIASIESKISLLEEKKELYIQRLQNVCKHKKTKRFQGFIEGDYTDRSAVASWDYVKCEECGKIVSGKTL